MADKDKRVALICWWCCHPPPNTNDKDKPLFVQCPVEYLPARIARTYHSYITRDVYVIKENVSMTKIGQIEAADHEHVNVIADTDRIVYDTHCRFCSYNCCLAYIRDNMHRVKYRMSQVLFFDDIRRRNIPATGAVITCAPPVHKLAVFGGDLDITEFRTGFEYPHETNVTVDSETA
jgi:hypothetical protein